MTDVLAENVRVRRAAQSLQQGDLADRMTKLGQDWTRSTVSAVERGTRNVTVDELLSLAFALKTDPAGLLDPRGITGREKVGIDLGPRVLPGNAIGAWLAHAAFLEAIWSETGEPLIEGFTFGRGDEPDSEIQRFDERQPTEFEQVDVEQVAEIKRLLDEGLTYKEIARRRGLEPKRVKELIQERGKR